MLLIDNDDDNKMNITIINIIGKMLYCVLHYVGAPSGYSLNMDVENQNMAHT